MFHFGRLLPCQKTLYYPGKARKGRTLETRLTAVKSFIGLAPGGQSFNLFLKVVYLFNARKN
jgi:hypothetical protein